MKKLLLGLGTLVVVAAPITFVVACGSEEMPITPENENQNPGTNEISVNDEQTRVNGFVSIGGTQQNEVVEDSSIFTTEIAQKYGLSIKLHTGTFSYEYTSTVTGITIMVTKVSDKSKPSVAANEIPVAPFSGISEEILNSITQDEVASAVDALVIIDNKMLPKDLTNLPKSIQITPLSNVEVSITVSLTWTKDNDTGSIKWIGTIAGRTNTDLLATTISGFKTTAIANQEKVVKNANSVTQEQIASKIDVDFDKNKLPSQVLSGLQTKINITPTTDETATVVVNLEWTQNDSNGSLKWTASIGARTNNDVLTGTISGFKDIATANSEAIVDKANSITQSQVETIVEAKVKPDSTKLPSQVVTDELPTTVEAHPPSDHSAVVIVSLLWNKNDSNGSLKWTATINNRTNSDEITGTISGFKTTSMANSEAIVDNANSITQSQVETIVEAKVKPDSTKLPSQVLLGLQTAINIIPTTDDTANVVVNLGWTANDILGTITWTAAINDRDNATKLTGTISGFKDKVSADREAILATIVIEGVNGSAIAKVDKSKYPEWVTDITLSGTTTNLSNDDKFTINLSCTDGYQGPTIYEYTVSSLLKWVNDSDILAKVSATGTSGSGVLSIDETLPEGVESITSASDSRLTLNVLIYITITYKEGYTGNNRIKYKPVGLVSNVITEAKILGFLYDLNLVKLEGVNGDGRITKIIKLYFARSMKAEHTTGLSNNDNIKIIIEYDSSQGYSGPQYVYYTVNGLPLS